MFAGRHGVCIAGLRSEALHTVSARDAMEFESASDTSAAESVDSSS
jgi:hypothetical protein